MMFQFERLSRLSHLSHQSHLSHESITNSSFYMTIPLRKVIVIVSLFIYETVNMKQCPTGVGNYENVIRIERIVVTVDV